MKSGDVISHARENAPYLCESLDLHPDIAARFGTDTPETLFSDLVKALPEEVAELEEEMAILRYFKRRAHLVIALADLSEAWSWVEVTEHLTQLADICMHRLLIAVARNAGIEGTPDNPVPGLFVLAVGKYGARELNYSSDIDFNIFYDPDTITLPDPNRAQRTLIRLSQALIRGFEAMTPEGYIFRTDLRLRPDPRSNAVAVSTHTAERYYETIGQNWERAAMIKARVCGGDMACGEAFISDVLSQFIWRRNLDYAAIEDILAIKRQIHASKSGHEISVPGHHLKLGKGGIREIEFYAQVQQLILGGRVPELRQMRTVDALAALAELNYVSPEDASALSQHYGFLRGLEHRAQMMKDAQTHLVPKEADDRHGLARLAAFDNLNAFEASVLKTLADVHRIYVALFPDVQSLSSREGNLVFTGVEADPETLATLQRLGYKRGEDVWQEMSEWLGGRIRATKTERAREYLTNLAPRLIDYCADTGEPDRAFFAFGRFFTVVWGGVSLLSMFNQAPERLLQLVTLMAQSPLIADRLAARPSILDAMADPAFLKTDPDKITADYSVLCDEAEDYERALNVSRRRVREDHFRISAAALTHSIAIDVVPEVLTKIADVTVQALIPFSIKEAERRFGTIEGEIAVLGLGKMGGREMSLTSDLDIMVIYRAAQDEENAQRKYTTVTQRLVNALSAVTEEGPLFEVDMALRPSGRSGPVAVSVEAFRRYYAERAWTWEFMALSRARRVGASSVEFGHEVERLVEEAVTVSRPDLNMQADVGNMLQRVWSEKPPNGSWDIKAMPGGLRDIEFIAQSLYLENREAFTIANVVSTADMLQTAKTLGLMTVRQANGLIEAVSFYQDARQYLSLMQGEAQVGLSEAGVDTLANLMKFPRVGKLEKTRQDFQKTVQHVIKSRFSIHR